MKSTFKAIPILILLLPSSGSAHSGGTDRYGCHTNRRTGDYHCHNPKSKASGEKRAKPIRTLATQTPIIVEQVQNNKGVIYIPPNTHLKPGDMLYSTEPNNSPAPQKPIIQEIPSKMFRPRTHNIQASYLSATTTLSSSESKSDGAALLYSRNFISFQSRASVILTKATNNSGASSAITSYSVGGQINLVDNIPGNDVIPYFAIDLNFIRYTQDSGGDYISAYGTAIGYTAGLIWYPLGEIFGVAISYGKAKTDVDYELNSTPSTVGYETGTFGVDYIFSF